MKNFIRKTATAASLTALVILLSLQVKAQDNPLIYNRNYNPAIGISVENATGAAFIIRDNKGSIVMKGKVRNNKTFFISTKSLVEGIYHFEIGGNVMQTFIIC